MTATAFSMTATAFSMTTTAFSMTATSFFMTTASFCMTTTAFSMTTTAFSMTTTAFSMTIFLKITRILSMLWVLLVLLYGLLKGGREIAKKKAMERNSVMEVLVVYTLLSFILVLPQIPELKSDGALETKYFFYIALKSFVMFLAWICGFRSLKKMPVSLYGVLSLSRVLFGTFLGIAFLGETLNVLQSIGLVIVCAGLLMLKIEPKSRKNQLEPVESVKSVEPVKSAESAEPVKSIKPFIILAFASCVLNAISGFMDKILMKDVTSAQLQVWYMLFLVIYYGIYVLITRQKISASVFKNPWVWALAVMFVIGDKALFIANGMSQSRITIMTLIKQSSCIVTIIGGRIFFKETRIAYKILCAAIVIFGILLGIYG